MNTENTNNMTPEQAAAAMDRLAKFLQEQTGAEAVAIIMIGKANSGASVAVDTTHGQKYARELIKRLRCSADETEKALDNGETHRSITETTLNE